MSIAAVVGQQGGLPSGGVEAIVWLLAGAGIVGLYVVISRTRRRADDAYRQRQRAEAERRANDPDMRPPDQPSS